MNAAPVDRIVFHEPGRERSLTLDEYLATPLSERVRHVLARTVSFYKDGTAVDRQTALKALMRLAPPTMP